MPAPACVDIVIVNWNSGDHLRHCVGAIARLPEAAATRVVVVDNGSTDASLEGLEHFGLALRVVRNRDNRGFGVACNQGASLGDAPCLLFLNPDACLQRDALRRSLAFLAAPGNAEVGIVGARLLGEDGRTLRSCAHRPSSASLVAQTLCLDRALPGLVPRHFMSRWDHCDTRQVEQVMGACLMIRRPLFERLSGFDERFFLYFEDVDLCARAAAMGARIVHLAPAAAWHVGGGSSGQVRDRRLAYWLTSLVQYAAKHQGRATAVALVLAALGVQLPARLVAALAAGHVGEALLTLRGATAFCRNLPRLLGGLAGAPPPAWRDSRAAALDGLSAPLPSHQGRPE